MSIVDSLLEYQKIDKQIYDMEKEVINSKEGVALYTVKTKGKQIMEDINKLDKQSGEIIKRFNELEQELKKLTSELKEYDNIVEELKSKDEAEYCLKKINDLIAQIEQVSKQIDDNNRLMDKTIKSAENKMKEHNNNLLDKAEKEKEFNELRKSFMPKVQELNGELNKLKPILGEVIVEKYQNLRKRNTKFPLVAELKGDEKVGYTCQGCFLEAPGAYVKMQESGQAIVECPSCGRLVYRK